MSMKEVNYDFIIDVLDFIERLIDFILSYPYIAPYANIVVNYNPLWVFNVHEALVILGYPFMERIYETSDKYIYLDTMRINIEDFLLEYYGIDIEKDEDYVEGMWVKQSFLNKMKKKYSYAFEEYERLLKNIKEYAENRGIEVIEIVNKIGDLNITIRKRIFGDKIKIIRELLDTVSQAYMKTYNIENESMKIEKSEEYYKAADKLKELVYEARLKIIEYKKKNKPIEIYLYQTPV